MFKPTLKKGSTELLVLGQVEVLRRRTSSRITMLSGDAGVGIGLPRRVKRQRTTSDHLGALDVYPTGRASCLRVREQSTDYSRLGGGQPASALLHFRRLVERIRRAAPEAAFDDRFALFDDGDPARASQVAAGPGVTVLDGVSRFARYSRLLWMAMHSADAGGSA